MGIAGDEALQYLVILPSSAGNDGVSKINADIVIGCHQINGRYGNKHKRWHDPEFATSSKGSMTQEVLANWLMKFQQYWPDLADLPRKRVSLFEVGYWSWA